MSDTDVDVRRVAHAPAGEAVRTALARVKEVHGNWQTAELLDRIATCIDRAIDLAAFRIREAEGPYRAASFVHDGSGAPKIPVGPMFPSFDDVRTTCREGAVLALLDTLDDFCRALLWEADCQEYVDALENSRQFLRAAGQLDLAEPHVLELARMIAEPAATSPT